MPSRRQPHHQEEKEEKQKRPRKKRTLAVVAYSPEEFSRVSGISRPVVYRMMQDGRLAFTQVTERLRRIPASEFVRLGLSGDAA